MARTAAATVAATNEVLERALRGSVGTCGIGDLPARAPPHAVPRPRGPPGPARRRSTADGRSRPAGSGRADPHVRVLRPCRSARACGRDRRFAVPHGVRRRHRVPARDRRGGLHGGVRARYPAHPHHQHEHPEPRGRAGDRVRDPRAGGLRANCSEPSPVPDVEGTASSPAGSRSPIMVLPIMIITTAEALRAVPRGIREAGFGVGATRWEVVRSHVLPYAAPGILTGVRPRDGARVSVRPRP